MRQALSLLFTEISAKKQDQKISYNATKSLSVALAGDSDQSLPCRCDRVVKPIDPFGYHMVGCKVGANAIRLHDEVVFTLANLFRSIGIEPMVEPVRLFDADPDLDDRRRPDILIRNPRGFDRQVTLDESDLMISN